MAFQRDMSLDLSKPIKGEYREWIAANVPAECRGLCAPITEQMQAVFPELRRVRGHYTPFADRDIPHWWLETAAGEIVDPTAAQFIDGGIGDYREYVGPEPTGHCLDCGGLLFTPVNSYFCNEACWRAFKDHLEAGGKVSVNGVELC